MHGDVHVRFYERLGVRFLRATHLAILSAGRAAQALEWTAKVMTALKLSLNQAKTSIRNGRRERFGCLGYSLGPEQLRPPRSGWYVPARPSKRSLAQLRASVAEVLNPAHTDPWRKIVAELNRKLRGWANYFSYGTTWQSYWAADWYVCDRIRGFLPRRHKVPTRGTRRFSEQYIYGNLGVLSLRSLRAKPA
jgi:RNA-directed DNA polymerase